MDKSGEMSYSEIIDFEGKCNSSIPDYPMTLCGATGQFIDNQIVICGGGPIYTKSCYRLNNSSAQFEKVYSMEDERIIVESTIIQGYMIVSGGKSVSEELDLVGTCEYINIQLSNNTAPKHSILMPESMYMHALVNINQSTFFLVGGFREKSSNVSNKTNFYHSSSNEWTHGPELIQGRNGHTVGVLIDHTTHMQHVAVVGGNSGNSLEYLNSTELLFHGENVWTQGIL